MSSRSSSLQLPAYKSKHAAFSRNRTRVAVLALSSARPFCWQGIYTKETIRCSISFLLYFTKHAQILKNSYGNLKTGKLLLTLNASNFQGLSVNKSDSNSSRLQQNLVFEGIYHALHLGAVAQRYKSYAALTLWRLWLRLHCELSIF